MRLKQGIAIAGTHGKTTTTSMTGLVLTEAGFDPTIVVGGQVRILGTGARLGSGEFLVAEADEYDRSFLELTPVVAVITNVEADHLDTYRDLDEIIEAFTAFANRVAFYGAVIGCADDPGVARVLPRVKRRVVTYGESPEAIAARAGDPARPDRARRFEVWDGERWLLGHAAPSDPRAPQRRQRARRRGGGPRALDPVSHGSPPPWRPSPASCAASRRKGRETACSSWTTTRITRRRSPRRSRPPGRSIPSAASWRSSSRTSSRARATSRPSSAKRSRRCDVAVVTDVYPSREKPDPRGDGELVVGGGPKKAGHPSVRLYC